MAQDKKDKKQRKEEKVCSNCFKQVVVGQDGRCPECGAKLVTKIKNLRVDFA